MKPKVKRVVRGVKQGAKLGAKLVGTIAKRAFTNDPKLDPRNWRR